MAGRCFLTCGVGVVELRRFGPLTLVAHVIHSGVRVCAKHCLGVPGPPGASVDHRGGSVLDGGSAAEFCRGTLPDLFRVKTARRWATRC